MPCPLNSCVEMMTMKLTHLGLPTTPPLSVPLVGAQPALLPPAPLSTVVTIGPNDDPQQMPQLTPLISDSVSRLAGWPFQPPTGNPSLITKQDYLDLIKLYPGE